MAEKTKNPAAPSAQSAEQKRPPSQSVARRWRTTRQTRFLAIFEQVGTVQVACATARVGRRTVYNWIAEDPDFAQRFDDARDIAADGLEREARLRATVGTKEPVYYQGEIVGYVQKKSDMLLIALLNAYRPERFRHRHEVGGKDGKPLITSVVHVSYDANMKPPETPT